MLVLPSKTKTCLSIIKHIYSLTKTLMRQAWCTSEITFHHFQKKILYC